MYSTIFITEFQIIPTLPISTDNSCYNVGYWYQELLAIRTEWLTPSFFLHVPLSWVVGVTEMKLRTQGRLVLSSGRPVRTKYTILG